MRSDRHRERGRSPRISREWLTKKTQPQETHSNEKRKSSDRSPSQERKKKDVEIVPSPVETKEIAVHSSEFMTKNLSIYEKVINSLTSVQVHQTEQQQFLQSENKELIRQDREREQKLREERQQLPPEFFALQRELLRLNQCSDVREGFSSVLDAMGKLADLVEREVLHKIGSGLTSPFKLGNLMELYNYNRGTKPDSLVGKVFGDDMARLRSAMMSDSEGFAPGEFGEKQTIPTSLSNPYKKRKRNLDETVYLPLKETGKICKVEIDAVALNNCFAELSVHSKENIRDVYLCKPKENTLQNLSSKMIVNVIDYLKKNLSAQSRNRDLLFLAFPEEKNRLPLIIPGSFTNNHVVTTNEEKKQEKKVTFRFSIELPSSNIIRFQETAAPLGHWQTYIKCLPKRGGLKDVTKTSDRSTWKTKILETLEGIISQSNSVS